MSHTLPVILRFSVACAMMYCSWDCVQSSLYAAETDSLTSVTKIHLTKTPAQVFTSEPSSLLSFNIPVEPQSDDIEPMTTEKYLSSSQTESTKRSEQFLPNRKDDFEPIFRIAKWLAIILGVAACALVVMKKWTRVGTQMSGNSYLKLIESISISNQFHVHLIEVGTQQFVVTTDRAGIKTTTLIADWNRFDVSRNDQSEFTNERDLYSTNLSAT